jgi:UDP-glucose 4-epimerase
MCKMLADHGHDVAVFDDLSTGHLEAVRWGTLYRGDLADPIRLAQVFEEFRPEGVLQFAARIVVSESVSNPALYYRTNVLGSLNLIEQVRRYPGCALVFSSTAAIFGEPQTPTIGEEHPKNPINPYGRSKLIVEALLADYWSAYRMPSVSFRYFNAAGADPSGEIGEAHSPETHLIPNVLESVLGRGGSIQVFGQDYSTRDGTCVRDYVHVNDLCRAHLQGLELMRSRPGRYAFNLGNGSGFTVKEVLDASAQVVGGKVQFLFAPRRAGDPPTLIADSGEARRVLNWQPACPRLEEIIESAWRWHRARKY